VADTREKLLEAKYFLERMKEKKSDRDAFKYNLSAFLSAARSVTFVMQNEFDKVPGFKEWYTEKQAKMQSDESKLLNDKRVMTIHIQLVQPHAHVMVTVEERISISDSVSVTIIRADSTIERGESEPMPPPAPTKTNTTTEWKWYFDELPNKDVVTVCEEHIVKLETLVAEYESRFTSR
jgi:hypothetical protein